MMQRRSVDEYDRQSISQFTTEVRLFPAGRGDDQAIDLAGSQRPYRLLFSLEIAASRRNDQHRAVFKAHALDSSDQLRDEGFAKILANKADAVGRAHAKHPGAVVTPIS